MKKITLKTVSAVILLSVFLSALFAANAYTEHFDIEDHHEVRISADEIYDESGRSVAKEGGNDKYGTVVPDGVKGAVITLYGFFACDVKITCFGYKYASDGKAVMNSDKFMSKDYDMLCQINENVTGKTGEVTRFRIDVPVREGDNELYAMVELETGEIYEIWRVFYTGEKAEDFGAFREEYVKVFLTVNGTDVVNRQYTVPGYIYKGYFELEMLSATAKIQESTGQESAAISVKVNGREVDFGSFYEMPPEHIVAVLCEYHESDVISLTYEKKSLVTLDANHGDGLTEKVYAVHGSFAAPDDLSEFARKNKIITDWNTKPDGSGRSCFANGYAVMPSEPEVDLNSLTLYAVWTDLGEPGDINGDGELDNKDAVVLFKYLSGADIGCDALAIDVNNDGNTDNKDVVVLFKYLSGGEVNAYYAGYATKYCFNGFRFDLPGGFRNAAAPGGDTLTMIGCCGDVISASVTEMNEEDFRDLPDRAFERVITENFDAGIISTQRLYENGRDTVIVSFVTSDSDAFVIRAVFACKDGKMLILLIYDISGFYIYDLRDAACSVG